MSHYFQDDPVLFPTLKRSVSKLTVLNAAIYRQWCIFKNTSMRVALSFLRYCYPFDLGENILDLGCGYGALGLTLAVAKPQCKVTLADINPRAMALCQRNATRLNLSQRVTILQSGHLRQY